MSASNKVTNALNFRPRALFNRLEAKDRDNGFDPIKADRIKVGNQVTAEYFNYKIPNTVSWGGQSTFLISRQEGMLYDMYLEIVLPTDAGIVWTPLTAVQAVSKYQLQIGQELINISGRAMFETARYFMSDVIAASYCAFAGGSGGTGNIGQSLFLYLDYPGRIRNVVADTAFSIDDSWGVPFPLNKCNNDMQITVTLSPASAMVSTGSAPVGIPQLILHYQVINSSNEQVQLTNQGKQNSKIVIPGYRINDTISSVPQTLSSTTILTYDISTTVMDAENIVTLVAAQLASDISANNILQGQNITNLQLWSNGTPYYLHQTALDGSFRQFAFNNAQKFITLPAGTGATQTTQLRTYMIAGSVNPFEVFSSEWSGVNMYRNNPQLLIELSTGGSVSGYIFCCTVNRCYYEIDQYGSIMWYTSKTSN